MILQKWDPKSHVYRPFNSPALKTVLVTRDMEVLIDCAECGKEIEFGISFTSRLIHTDMGFGYPVCEVCYKVECTSLQGQYMQNIFSIPGINDTMEEIDTNESITKTLGKL